MRKSASPAPGIVTNLTPSSTNTRRRHDDGGGGGREENAPSVRVLARANHTLERGTIQQRIIVP